MTEREKSNLQQDEKLLQSSQSKKMKMEELLMRSGGKDMN